MNDFTKAELQEIAFALEQLPIKWNGFDKRWKSDLQIKVLTMIDNYCEHPNNMSAYSLGVEYCVKCKRQLNDKAV